MPLVFFVILSVVFFVLFVVVLLLYIHNQKERKKTKVERTDNQSIITELVDGESTTSLPRIIADLPSEITFEVSLPNIEPLRFQKLSPTQVKKYTNHINNPVNIIPGLAVTAHTIKSASGLYAATAKNVNQLMTFANGTKGSAVLGDGKILQHAGFSEVSPASIFTPLLVFQVMSIVTGQYYLHGISEQLSQISEQLNQLIEMHTREREAKLSIYYNRLNELANREMLTFEDLIQIQNIRSDTLVIKEEKIRELYSVDTHEWDDLYLGLSTASTMMGKLIDSYKLLQIERKVDTILLAERISFTAKAFELKYNMMECSREPSRVTKTYELYNEISKEYNSDMEEPEYIRPLEDLFSKIDQITNTIRDQSLFAKSIEACHECKDNFKELYEQHINRIFDTHVEFAEFTEHLQNQLNEPIDILLIVDEKGGIQTTTLDRKLLRS